MDAEVSDAQLRRFVVRIDTPKGDFTRGTGVLVAPGWVLSCAHVVEGLDNVRVVPDQSAAGPVGDSPTVVVGWVRARSAAHQASSGTAFWPFPDLAVIELDGWSDHLFAPMAMAEPRRSGETHAWGFGARETGMVAVGSPASFIYVGEEGDGFLSLKAGDAPPGLSGAPLVCPVRRAVVGVMSVSRNPADARGGWASPVTALAGGAGVPDELVRLGAQIVALNRAEAWRHRDAWNRVLPVPGADRCVDRPWVGVDVDHPAVPSTMLRAEFGVVGYDFHGAELAAALSWCESSSPIGVSYIDAPGGAGKTRFALEVSRQMDGRGWVAGLLPGRDRGVSEVALARLVAVDYVEERDASALTEQIAALARSATAMTPVRVLLLSRPTEGQRRGAAMDVLRQQAEAKGAVMVALDAAKDRSGAVSALTIAERGILFNSALLAFGRRWHGAGWAPSSGGQVDLSAERYARPLDVLLEAFDAALSGPEWRSGGRPPVERALDHEERHWKARVPGLEPLVLRRCAALATLAGARDQREAQELLVLVPDLGGESATAAWQRADRWLRGLYDGPDRWNPLRPDRLAEALVTRTLHDNEDGGQGLLLAIFGLPSDTQIQRALDVVARLAGDPDTAGVIAAALASRHQALVDRCVRQAHGTPERPGRTGLLDGLVRLHTAVLTDERLAGLPPSVQAQLSMSADILGDLASDHGRSAEAWVIFAGALAIDQRKHKLDPGNTTYRHDLSVSFNKLADLARAAGRPGEAEGLYRQSLQVAQDLAERDPGNTTYRRDLSVSFNRLADLALAAGRPGEAEGLYRQSLQVAQDLAERDPGNTTYRRDLSISYERLADLTRAEDMDSAPSLIERAVALRRGVHDLDQTREDLAVEFAYALYLGAEIAAQAGQQGVPEAHRGEVIEILTPFDTVGLLGGRGRGLLVWAQGSGDDRDRHEAD